MGIAQSVLDCAEEHLRERAGCRLMTIGMRLGEMSGVDRESLGFCFECLVKDTPLDHVRLAIEYRPGGDELEVTYLELEEP